MQAPIDGKEERLDAILAELCAIRARMEGYPIPVPRVSGDEIELREPAKKEKRK